VPENASSELKKVKKELANCKRKLKEAEAFNERLRSVISYDELGWWQPKQRIEKQYGWVYAWLFPLSSYIDQNLNQPLTPEIRNKIHNIVTAIIAQLAVSGKYGINLLHDPREVDIADFKEKQNNIFNQTYEPCAICGETRITHECHIIPRSEGGVLHRDNFVMLCPLHHHLFDHARLTKDEWDVLSIALSGKMEAAVIYANEVRLPLLQVFWRGI
jgi:hypothetical protein